MMADAGIPTPKYYVAETVAQATKAAHDLGGTDCVLKAQVGAIYHIYISSFLCGCAIMYSHLTLMCGEQNKV